MTRSILPCRRPSCDKTGRPTYSGYCSVACQLDDLGAAIERGEAESERAWREQAGEGRRMANVGECLRHRRRGCRLPECMGEGTP
jgi:hypothetical protein